MKYALNERQSTKLKSNLAFKRNEIITNANQIQRYKTFYRTTVTIVNSKAGD